MAKLLWHNTMSLDGFISSPDGDMMWMLKYAGRNPVVDAVHGPAILRPAG